MTKRADDRKWVGVVFGAVLVALTAGACGGLGPYPTAEFTTVNPAWVNWFRLDWASEDERSGTRRIAGYVHNGHGQEASEVMLLTQALDTKGAVVGQRVTWAGSVPALSRAYFEVRSLPAAEQYRVTVWSFSFQEAQGWM